MPGPGEPRRTMILANPPRLSISPTVPAPPTESPGSNVMRGRLGRNGLGKNILHP